MMEIIGYFLAILVGLSLGLIGGGGSILTLPIMVYIFSINPLLATSYSLFVVGISSLLGAILNYYRGFVSIKTGLWFGLTSITTVVLTRKFILPIIPEILYEHPPLIISRSLVIMLLFALLMFMSAMAMIRKKNIVKPTETSSEHGKPIFIKLFLYGILVGLATGFLGAGGGFLLIPALVLLLNMPMKNAVGTSLFIIALNSLMGFVSDSGHFIIDWYLLLSFTGFALVGIIIGMYLSKKISGQKLKKIFGWFILIMAVYIIVREVF